MRKQFFMHPLRSRVALLCLKFFIFILSFCGFSATKSSAQCSLVCNGSTHASLNEAGIVTLTTRTILISSSNTCTGAPTLMIIAPDGTPLSGNTIDCTYLGKTLTVKILQNGNICWGTVSIEDYIAPTVTCSDLTFNCGDDTTPNALDGRPTATDNCGTTNLTYTYIDEPLVLSNCDPIFLGQFRRSWTVTDKAGLKASCQQTIYIRRLSLPSIDFPDDITIGCEDSSVPEDIGEPQYNGEPISSEQQTACGVLVTYIDGTPTLGCGGTSSFVRTWIASDNCSTMNMATQMISIQDNVPPTITLPETITIGTDDMPAMCSVTDPILPEATVNDICSSPVTVAVTSSKGNIDGNGGVLTGTFLAAESFLVTYTATDACGNTATATATITIVDDDPPNTLCAEDITIDIDVTGTVVINAKDLDGGSTDNCCVGAWQVKCEGADDATYTDEITFTCSNIGAKNLVLRVGDCVGNYSTCTLSVTIRDVAAPTIACPDAVTIVCERYSATGDDTDFTGAPIVIDGCGSTIQLVATDIKGTCSNDLIPVIRTWTATDNAGNSATCTQQIALRDQAPPLWDNEDGSLDITVSCFSDNPNTQPTARDNCDDAPSITLVGGDPVFSGDCSTGEAVATYTYYATDGCANQSLPFIKKVTIRQEGGFLLTFKEPFPANINTSEELDGVLDCQIPLAIPSVTATDCNTTVAVSNDRNLIKQNINGQDSYIFPVGTTILTYTATDICDNTGTRTLTVEVTDISPPSFTCAPQVRQLDATTKEVTLNTNIINTNLADCSQPIQITGNQTVTYNCSNLGNNPVTLTFTDALGNTNTCTNNIIITTPVGVSCTSPFVEPVALGSISTPNGQRLAKTKVQLIDNQKVVMNDSTDKAGYFIFGNLERGRTCTLRPTKNDDILNGVSTFDLVVMQKHILGTQLFDSPYQYIAADVNRSGTISTVDVLSLRRLILNDIKEMPNNQAWRFIDATHIFPKNANPLATTFPEFQTLNNISENTFDSRFIAVKIGDANLSANPKPTKSTARTNETDYLNLNVKDKILKKGENYTIELTSENFKQVVGFQFSLHFDQEILEFRGIEEADLSNFDLENVGLTHLEEGRINLSWNVAHAITLQENQILCKITFKAKKDGRLSQNLTLSEALLAEAYIEPAENKGINAHEIRINYNQTTNINISNKPELYQNRPNPFKDETLIGFTMPEACRANISVSDASGHLIHFVQQQCTKGYNEVILHKKDLKGANDGIYFYQLISPFGSATKQLIMNDE